MWMSFFFSILVALAAPATPLSWAESLAAEANSTPTAAPSTSIIRRSRRSNRTFIPPVVTRGLRARRCVERLAHVGGGAPGTLLPPTLERVEEAEHVPHLPERDPVALGEVLLLA